MKLSASSTLIVSLLASFLALLVQAADLFDGNVNSFTSPFNLRSESLQHQDYSQRLERHLRRTFGMDRISVRPLPQAPLSEILLNADLRYDGSSINLIHLGRNADGSPGFALAHLISHGMIYPDRRVFALLSAHPRIPNVQLRDNHPRFVVHGYAQVEDLNGNAIEEMISRYHIEPHVLVEPGYPISISRAYDDLISLGLNHHP